jgi:hypothetical protein
VAFVDLLLQLRCHVNIEQFWRVVLLGLPGDEMNRPTEISISAAVRIELDGIADAQTRLQHQLNQQLEGGGHLGVARRPSVEPELCTASGGLTAG